MDQNKINGTNGNGTNGNGTNGNGTNGTNGTNRNGTNGNGTNGIGTNGNGTNGNGTNQKITITKVNDEQIKYIKFSRRLNLEYCIGPVMINNYNTMIGHKNRMTGESEIFILIDFPILNFKQIVFKVNNFKTGFTIKEFIDTITEIFKQMYKEEENIKMDYPDIEKNKLPYNFKQDINNLKLEGIYFDESRKFFYPDIGLI
jgi:hypothetical protein